MRRGWHVVGIDNFNVYYGIRLKLDRDEPLWKNPNFKSHGMDICDFEMEMLPMQPGDVYATCASVDKLRNAVGYEPKTSIREGIPRFRKVVSRVLRGVIF